MLRFQQFLREFDSLYNLLPDQVVSDTYNLRGRYLDFNSLCFDNRLPHDLPVIFDQHINETYKNRSGGVAKDVLGFAVINPPNEPKLWSIHIVGSVKVFVRDEIDAILLHEMAHIAVALDGNPTDSASHGPIFRATCNNAQQKAKVKSSVINADHAYLDNLKSQTAPAQEVWVQLIVTRDDRYIARFLPASEDVLQWAKHFASYESNPQAERSAERMPYETYELVGAVSYFLKTKIPVPQHAFQKTFLLSPKDGKALFKKGHFTYEVKDGNVYTATLKKITSTTAANTSADHGAVLFHTPDNKWFVMYSKAADVAPDKLRGLVWRLKGTTGAKLEGNDRMNNHVAQSTATVLLCPGSFLPLSKETKLWPEFRGPVRYEIHAHEADRLLSFSKPLARVVAGEEK